VTGRSRRVSSEFFLSADRVSRLSARRPVRRRMSFITANSEIARTRNVISLEASSMFIPALPTDCSCYGVSRD
jgi:hypothetical protein